MELPPLATPDTSTLPSPVSTMGPDDMPLINFYDEFADMVEDGSKQRTIRKPYKRPIFKGDTLHLYANLRTKRARKLLTARCNEIRPVSVDEDGRIYLDNLELSSDLATVLANSDGFDTSAELVDFLTELHGLPFDGVLIGWEYPEPDDQ